MPRRNHDRRAQQQVKSARRRGLTLGSTGEAQRWQRQRQRRAA